MQHKLIKNHPYATQVFLRHLTPAYLLHLSLFLITKLLD